jgi:tRNA uridine 5-carbamoylmethylation protein Kti12
MIHWKEQIRIKREIIEEKRLKKERICLSHIVENHFLIKKEINFILYIQKDMKTRFV